MKNVEVFIEGNRLDLFENETINLNRAVQDIKDISKIYTDFTQTFSVPASKNNQKIFKHFEIPEIDGGYDTRIKKEGNITIQSLDFVKGKIRLEGVDIKNNQPTSFKITFFGDLVALKDLLREDKLKDLEWLSQFDHVYSPVKVIEGMTTGLNFNVDGTSQPVIKYPMISPVNRFVFDSVTASTSDQFVNIIDPGFDWYELKPSISFEWIIKAIEEKYNISFSGNFFTRPEFKTLQLWLSPDKGFMKASGRTLMPFPTNQFITNNKFTGTLDGNISGSKFPDEYTINLQITPTTDAKYTVTVEDNGQPYLTFKDQSGSISKNIMVTVEEGEIRNFSFAFYLESEEALVYDATLTIQYSYWQENNTGEPAGPENSGYQETTDTSTLSNQNINENVVILQQVPDLKVIDFLQGIFKMFNLTIVPKDGELDINNLEEWYAEGRIIDISEHIDVSSVNIDKGTVLGQINMLFEEGKSFLINEFKDTYRRSYGDLEYVIRDSFGEKIDGETLEIKLPFEQMIYERLSDQNDGTLTNVVYGYCVDDKQEPYDIKSHVFYPIKRELSTPINVLDKSKVKNPVSTIFCPSHVGGLGLSNFATIFSTDFEEYSGDAITSNLLTNYYLDYLTDIFSSKRRVFNFKAKLPAKLLRDIKLNDRLINKGRRYIINTMDLDLTTGDADLELINDIYRGETQDSLINKMILSSTYAEYENIIGGGSFTYQTNETENSLVKLEVLDLGYGNQWVTATQNGNTINYTVDANTGADRYTAIKLTGLNFSESYHKIKQHA